MNSKRLRIIVIFVFLFMAVLLYKLVNIQIIQAEELRYKAERQQTKEEIVKAERGTIFDRNNVTLALNINTVSVAIDFRMLPVKERDSAAVKFAKVFEKPVSYYATLFKDKNKTVYIEKKVDLAKANLLKDADIKGLIIEDDPSRRYPQGTVASHVVGYVNADFLGTNGIEKFCDEQLKGVDGKKIIYRNAMGEIVTVSEDQTLNPVEGDNVVLTIDFNYQKILERELKNGLAKFGGISATGIIMNPNTGEILALANENDYDPNLYSKFSDTLRRNIAVTDVYEPGSTFKSFTMAALLDKQLAREEESIFCENGKYQYKNVTITDSHNKGALTVRGVIEQSSNIGISKLVQRIEDEDYYKYVRAFGFGNQTDVELPGEVKGSVKNPKDWHLVTKAFMSFGYELLVTPMQLAAAYCALVNGGTLYKPQIIKEIRSVNGVLKNEFKPKVVRTVISASTSAKMRSFLTGVVTNGTAKSAQIDGLTVGGKTGTSQKLINGSYSKSHYNSSFVGFFPVDKPEIVCLILFNSPSAGLYGGLVAAPVFKEIGTALVQVDPKRFNKEIKTNDIKVVYANQKNENDIRIKSTTDGLSEKLKNKIMPDFTNCELKEATNLLTRNGIKVKVKGSGKVISQSIKPGASLKKIIECILTCK